MGTAAKMPKITRYEGALNKATMCRYLEEDCRKAGRDDLARLAEEANSLAINAAHDFEAAQITDRHISMAGRGDVERLPGFTRSRAYALRSAGLRKRRKADSLYEQVKAALDQHRGGQ